MKDVEFKTITHFTGVREARRLAKEYDAVLSLGEVLGEQHRRADAKYLYLDFDDLDLDDMNTPIEGDKFCQLDHIQDIIKFVRELKPEDRLLIHCFAGLNRSSAATIIARCERENIPYWHAVQRLNAARVPEPANINPNSLMVHHYLQNKTINIAI